MHDPMTGHPMMGGGSPTTMLGGGVIGNGNNMGFPSVNSGSSGSGQFINPNQ